MERVPVVRTSDLSIGYILKGGQKKRVHDALGLNLYPGEVTCLPGLDGAGKSTLLRILYGFQSPLGGEIGLMGKPLNSYPQGNFSRLVGVVLTEKTNTGGVTVYELVSLGRHPYTGFFRQLRQGDHRIIEESLAATGIAHKAYNYVLELSDGERQKAMIAKALAQQCPIILLDELMAFLDMTSQIETVALLHALTVEQQKAILLSTHDLDLVIQLGDCLWLQGKKRPMAYETPEDLIMGGAFKTFFGKEGIVLDPNIRELNTVAPTKPIRVAGDFTTPYWVGNALIRGNFKPSSISEDCTSVCYNAPGSLRIQFPAEGGTRTIGGATEMVSIIIRKS